MQLTKLLARLGLAAFALSTLNLQLSTAFAQGTAFTYQGVLSQNGAAINGSNDLTFTLYNAVSAGATVGTSNVVNDLVMSNGLFTVTLDFGAGAFDGSARWLQIAARPGVSTGAYTNLAPRTPITPTPYAIFASGAAAAGVTGTISPTNLPNGLGGSVNTASGVAATVAGGNNNTASGTQSTVGGGVLNVASGFRSTVPGGLGNIASGDYSFAAGQNARATNQGAFVWADSQNAFFDSTTSNSFNVRAQGGARFVTSGKGMSLDGPLDVATNAVIGNSTVLGPNIHDTLNRGTKVSFGYNVPGTEFNGMRAVVNPGTANCGNSGDLLFYTWECNPSGSREVMRINGTGNVGIGTTNPLTTLDVRSDTPEITVGTIFNTDGALYFGNPGHGVKRAYSGGNDVGLYTTAADVYLSANGTATSEFVLKNNGNVGIGTSSPATKLQVAGTVTATGFSGNGSGLSGIAAGSVTGTFGAAQIPNLDAAKIASGTLADSRLSTNVALRSGGNTFSGQQVITGGNLGIRATNPMGSIGYPGGWEGLHVQSPTGNGLNIIQGASTARLHLRADNNITNVAQDFIMANGANRIDFERLGGGLAGRLIAMTIATNGNVGIAGEVTTTAVNITSDRNAKEQFKPVNAREVLAKVARLPISEWQYKTQSDARHIGPMAQDFREAFTLGHDEKHISTVDEGGVALAAILGLNEKLDEKTQEVDALKKSVAALTELVNKLATQQNGGAK